MKNIIQTFYYYILDFLIFRKIIPLVQSNLKYRIFDSGYLHTFFGYYDKSPFSSNSDIILAHSTNVKNETIVKPETAAVGYFNFEKPDKFFKLGDTTTWCWQQGARLMWYPNSDNELIIYNKIVNNKYGSCIQDIKSGAIIKELNFPIYDINFNGTLAATLNFSRLDKFRAGYGYANFPDEANINDSDDGIWIYDIKNNTKKLLINFNKLKEMNKIISNNYYLNHLSFSPDGTKLLFYFIVSDLNIRKIKAYVYHFNNDNIVLLNQGRNCSHFTWKNNNELLIYSNIDNNYVYAIHNVSTGEITTPTPQLIRYDGHPSFINENTIITDSYPIGLFKRQNLYLYNLKKTYQIIAKIATKTSYSYDYRCDLHPRINADNKKICIDLPSKTGRKLAVFDL